MRPVRPAYVELRQYVIAPGRRARMIELFDTYFADAQDALGLPILGQFEAVGDPDRLVWLRGFDDMASRPERLGAFYGGAVWTQHGAEAIGYVTGYDNVQLLRAAEPGCGLQVDLDARPHAGALVQSRGVSAGTYRLQEPAGASLIERVRGQLGRSLLGLYVSDPTPNNFPVLPIREGEHLLTWFAADQVHDVDTPDELLRLQPTPRSILR